MSSASSDDKNIKEQQPTEIRFRIFFLISDNRSVSSMSVHGASITTALLDRDCIPRKYKKRNFQKFQSLGIK